MTEIFKIVVKPNLVKTTVQEWNGRDSDELHGFDHVTKIIQKGWKWELSKSSYEWLEVMIHFKNQLNEIERIKNKIEAYDDICKIDFKFNFTIPYSVEVELNDNDFNLIETLIIEDETFEEEVFYFQKRIGMSTNYLFGDKPILSAPIKSNNKEGATVRGYASSLLINNDLQKEEEFYLSVLSDFKTEIL
jgi:hypothetical protein